MKPLKISIFGADGFTCQAPRIKEGMKNLGHTISEDDPDVIYANDPSGYSRALQLKNSFPKSFLIFNFLDLPWHIKNIQKQTESLVKFFLNKADIVTVISFKVKKDLSKFFSKEIKVIYNPIKDVFYDPSIKKDNDFLYVGRANDPIKRISLVKESLLRMENTINKIKICGSENPGFGNYLGVISDIELNKLYNSSKYLYLTSKAEGLGLTMIEALVCGSIPIACSDNETAKEFLPKDFICDPNAVSIIKKIEELNKVYDEKRKLSLDYGVKYKIQFDKKMIAENIINLFNKR